MNEIQRRNVDHLRSASLRDLRRRRTIIVCELAAWLAESSEEAGTERVRLARARS